MTAIQLYELPETPGRKASAKTHRLFRCAVLALYLTLLNQYGARRGRRGIRPCDVAALLGVSLRTIRDWQRRSKHGKNGLSPDSRKPRRFRAPVICDAKGRDLIVKLWHAPAATNNETLRRQLAARGYAMSLATLKRTLAALRKEGRIDYRRAGKKGKACCGNRKRGQSSANKAASPYQRAIAAELAPGARIQMDTLFARYGHSHLAVIIALDVATRHVWHCEVHELTSSAAASLLRKVCADRRFPALRAVQVDGGSEFAGVFAVGCGELGVARMVNPPGNPKCNAFVESFNNTLRRECLNRLPRDVSAAQLRRALAEYIAAYNNERCHSGLGGISPIMALKRTS